MKTFLALEYLILLFKSLENTYFRISGSIKEGNGIDVILSVSSLLKVFCPHVDNHIVL